MKPKTVEKRTLSSDFNKWADSHDIGGGLLVGVMAGTFLGAACAWAGAGVYIFVPFAFAGAVVCFARAAHLTQRGVLTLANELEEKSRPATQPLSEPTV